MTYPLSGKATKNGAEALASMQRNSFHLPHLQEQKGSRVLTHFGLGCDRGQGSAILRLRREEALFEVAASGTHPPGLRAQCTCAPSPGAATSVATIAKGIRGICQAFFAIALQVDKSSNRPKCDYLITVLSHLTFRPTSTSSSSVVRRT